MLANLLVVLPIFALILTGWIARRSGVLGPDASREVNRLVIYLAMPALLFDIMATARAEQIWQPGFILAFAGGCAAIFVITICFRMRQGRHLADATIDALNASYANTGFMGFALVFAVLGEAGMGPTLIATILTVSVLFAIGVILIEGGLQSEGRRRDIVRRTLLSLVRNPLLIAPVLGTAFMMSGWALPAPVHTYLKLLGAAASPCALVALGLFLAGNAQRERTAAGRAVENLLIFLKLIAHPFVTWLVAGPILGLPATITHAAVLLAALPTGTGPFLLAEFYGREALLTGRVVLKTTMLSVVTLSVYLALAS